MIDKTQLWTVIIGLAVASFGLRFVILGLVGDRRLPLWMVRHLRYTAVAVIPALVAPLVVWPSETGGQVDPWRIAAGLAALAVGTWSKSLYAAIFVGAAIFAFGQYTG